MSIYQIGALVERMLINQGTSMDTVRALKWCRNASSCWLIYKQWSHLYFLKNVFRSH